MYIRDMNRRPAILFALLLTSAAGLAQAPSGQKIDNQFLTITVSAGWTVAEFIDQKLMLQLTRGNYVLQINPVFTHASGVEGGRFNEIVAGMPSVDAVMGEVDQPAGGFECSQSSAEPTVINDQIKLYNLYTDSSKTESPCKYPADGRVAWFGSFSAGDGPESEYTITLAYATSDVNALPKKGSNELESVFAEVAGMLKTLRLKPPITLSRIEPASAPPGTMVTIYGTGLNIPAFRATVRFSEIPNQFMPDPVLVRDGTSLMFQVPASMQMISCPEGRIEVNEGCVPTPANHVDVNDCPRIAGVRTNFCGVPMQSGTYHVSVVAGNSVLSTEAVPFAVTSPKPPPVFISLLYPNYLVSVGSIITVRGRGFAPTGNTVRIGSAVVSGVDSPDGVTLSFPAPAPAGQTLFRPLHIYEATVSNSNGTSNPILFWYR